MTTTKPTAGRSLLDDSIFSLISQVVGLLFALASGIVLARMLGAEARGEYGMLILLPQTAVALLAGGIGPAVAYSLSSNRWQDEEVIPLTLGLCAYATGIGLILISIALLFRDALIGNLRLELLLWAVMIYPASLCISALHGVFIGYRRFRLQMKCAIWAAASNFTLLLIPVYVLEMGIRGAIYGHVAGLRPSVVIYAFCAGRIISRPCYCIEWRWRKIAASFSFGGKASAANAIAFLNYRVDQFFVNSMVGAYGVGIYVLAVSIVEKLWILASNLAVAMFPRVASGKSSEDEAAELTARVAGLLMVALLISGTAAAALAWVVPRVYGNEFADSVAVIQWLLPGCILLGHAKLFSNFFAGRGKPGLNVVAGVVGLAVNVSANLFLIPRFGVLGAAAATSCSYAVISLICYGLFVTQYGVSWYAPLIPRWCDVSLLAEQGIGLLRHLMGRAGAARRVME